MFSRNERQALAPASAEKLAVSFAALRLLGPGYRFRTEVAGRGALVGGIWRGDLFLVGHGDPTLAPADLDALARDVAAWGIRRVAGRVLGDERHFDSARSAPGWKPWFLGVESAPLSALSVDDVVTNGANGSAAAAARAFRSPSSGRGISVRGAPGTARLPARCAATRQRSLRATSRDRADDESRERQLRLRDALEGARRQRRRRGSTRRGSRGRA